MSKMTNRNQREQKSLDAVRMMREIRNDLSRKLMKMSHEEQGRYIKEQLETEIDGQHEDARQRSSVRSG